MARRKRSGSSVSFFSFQDILIGTIGIILMMTIILILLIGKEFVETTIDLEDREQLAIDRKPALEDEVDELQRSVRDLESIIAADRSLRRLELRRALFEYLEDLEQTKEDLEDRRSKLEDLANEAELDGRALRALELMKVRDELREINTQTRLNPRVTYQLANAGDVEPIIIEISRSGVIFSSIHQAKREERLDLQDPDSFEEFAQEFVRQIAAKPNLQSRYLLFVIKPSGIPLYYYLHSLILNHPTLGNLEVGYDLLTEDSSISETFDSRGEA